jgi:hypothetical protein
MELSGMSQILALNRMLTVGREVVAPNVAERADDTSVVAAHDARGF